MTDPAVIRDLVTGGGYFFELLFGAPLKEGDTCEVLNLCLLAGHDANHTRVG
jgi:hypothetical protein